MAFLPFGHQQYFRVLESNETAKCGYFNLLEDIEIQQAICTLYIHGTLGGSEQLRMHIYGSVSATIPMYTSDWFTVSGVGTYSPNWLGNIFFDFASKPLDKDIDYFFSVQAQNYTRNLDTYYLALGMDWYPDTNSRAVAQQTSVRIGILGLK